MFRYSVLLLALVLSLPALWAAFVEGSMPPEVAVLRFLIAMPVATAMLVTLRHMTSGYKPKHPGAAVRRDDNHPTPDPAASPTR